MPLQNKASLLTLGTALEGVPFVTLGQEGDFVANGEPLFTISLAPENMLPGFLAQVSLDYASDGVPFVMAPSGSSLDLVVAGIPCYFVSASAASKVVTILNASYGICNAVVKDLSPSWVNNLQIPAQVSGIASSVTNSSTTMWWDAIAGGAEYEVEVRRL